MSNNVTREDLDILIEYLQQEEPRLTQGRQVRAFEADWNEWLGTQHSVFVNSGSSANLLTMTALRILRGEGEVITPTLTWVSDIASVLQSGMTPVFVDIDPHSLGMSVDAVLEKITPKTKAVFLTHILGYDALEDRLIDELKARNILLIEDVCESHGATHGGRKLGSIGHVSNFSFYYAHHMSTIEGGMICTNDDDFYHTFRMLRSHGMTREAGSDEVKAGYVERHPDLTPDFIFAHPAYNVRSTELNAVIGRNQLKRLDANNVIRRENLDRFLDGLNDSRFRTSFKRAGNSNYAFTLVLKDADEDLRERVEGLLKTQKVESRRGTSGGGNQLRQPYLRARFPEIRPEDFPEIDHVHFFGYYIGNYPDLEKSKIDQLTGMLNEV